MKSRDKKSSCYKTRHGNWNIRFKSDTGKVVNKVCKTKTDRDALQRAIKRGDSLNYWFPDSKSSSPISYGNFDSLASQWLDHSEKVREISESCLINYRSHLKNHVLPEIGSKLLKELSLIDVENLAKTLKAKKPRTKSYRAIRNSRVDEEFFEDDDFLSTAYRREILTVACMVTKYGFERGLLPENPFRKFKLPDTPEQPYDYWRLEEEDVFLDWLEKGGVFHRKVAKPGTVKRGAPSYYMREFRMRPGKAGDLFDVTLFALRSGLRKGEIGALRPCDVNFEKNCIIVRRSYSEKEGRMKKTTKSKTFRFVEMNADMREILRRRIAKAKSQEEVLFLTSSWAVRNFSKYCEKAGVRTIHFHSLRHTCLTNLANGYGMDSPLPLPQVQKIAGHRDISTTMRYVHTDGIENTSSKQWSRSARRKITNEGKAEVVEGTFLRLVKK